jgi:hypothetical protein
MIRVFANLPINKMRLSLFDKSKIIKNLRYKLIKTANKILLSKQNKDNLT